IGGEELEQPLIDEQLVVVEVQVRVDLVAFEQVVADRQLTEEIRLPQRHLLTMAGQRVEQLRLKAGAVAVRVEVGGKRVVGAVGNDRGIEAGSKAIGQRGLSDTQRTFDGDVPEVQGSASIAAARAGRPPCDSIVGCESSASRCASSVFRSSAS